MSDLTPPRRTRILKLREHDEAKEIEFEWLSSLTVQERFDLMFQESEEIRRLLIQSGHGTPPEIVRRARD